ncbi:MAG TPA: ABC transporter permease [Mycobacteriales bacterium]|jgi:simple sugar transport system permease protein|nr:ABC transporter permease [Mycobacteriales bacterium]
MTLMAPIETAPPSARGRRLRLPHVLLLVAGGIVLLAAVRVLTGADDLTSRGTMREALQWAVPIGLAGLGGLWSERAGIVNIGLEGMMILGTWFGAYAGVLHGPWAGVAVGILGGALGGLLHAVATVTFGVDHIVSGVAITILGAGLARYLSGLTFANMAGGGPTQSPTIADIGTITVPGVSEAMKALEDLHWFLLSDVAGLIGGVTTGLSLLTIVAIALVPLTYVVLWRTPFGLRLRSAGESPVAAESLGVNVYLYKYLAVIVSGGLAGLGGVYLAEVSSSIYREGQVNGRGYIGLATMIFGNWRPGGLAAGAGLFGFTDALQQRPSGGESVHALLLFVAVVVGAVGAWHVYRRRWVSGGITLAVALAVFAWFTLQSAVPDEFVRFMPHLTTLLVLALASQRLRMPAADGMPYRRGQGR